MTSGSVAADAAELRSWACSLGDIATLGSGLCGAGRDCVASVSSAWHGVRAETFAAAADVYLSAVAGPSGGLPVIAAMETVAESWARAGDGVADDLAAAESALAVAWAEPDDEARDSALRLAMSRQAAAAEEWLVVCDRHGAEMDSYSSAMSALSRAGGISVTGVRLSAGFSLVTLGDVEHLFGLSLMPAGHPGGSWQSGDYVIETGDGHDTVEVTMTPSGEYVVTVNGVSGTLTQAEGENLVIKTEGGDDTITVDGSAQPMVLSQNASLQIDSGADDDNVIVNGTFNNAAGATGALAVFAAPVVSVKTGDGDDRVAVNGVINVPAGTQNPSVRIDAGDDNDIVTLAPTLAVGMWIAGGSGHDQITGGSGGDVIVGGSDNDTIDGGAGNDVIKAGSGQDTIDGGDDDDEIEGGGDNDTIHGGDGEDDIVDTSGDDTIYGNADRDYIDAGTGEDTVDGGAGNDVIYGGTDGDVIVGGGGRDYIDGGEDGDSIDGGVGRDIISGGDGDDTLGGGSAIDVIYAGPGDDTVTGGLGQDEIYAEADDTVTDASSGEVTEVTIDMSVLDNIEIDPNATPEEKARIEADLVTLASSPEGQRILTEVSASLDGSGGTIVIEASGASGPLGRFTSDGNGGGTITYDLDYPIRSKPPILTLVHELSHGYHEASSARPTTMYVGPDSHHLAEPVMYFDTNGKPTDAAHAVTTVQVDTDGPGGVADGVVDQFDLDQNGDGIVDINMDLNGDANVDRDDGWTPNEELAASGIDVGDDLSFLTADQPADLEYGYAPDVDENAMGDEFGWPPRRRYGS